jgi:hypothetical protein
MSRTNYVFIDFENVQETEWDRIANKPVQVTLVLGEQHKSLPVTLVRKFLQYAGQVALVETGRSGRNALDLVLAHHIGAQKKTDPQGYFHILSRDKDFDALIGHLRDNDILAARHASFSEIPILMNLAERVKLLAGHFRANQATRPKKRTTVASQIQAIFGRAQSTADIEDTIQALVKVQIIALLDNGEVAYRV